MDLSQSQGGFRSRRSYPSLNHVSLAPLTPRFPIDDDEEPQDYFSPRNEESPPTYSGYETPPRTSYLASFSVPGTPGVLSHSRSGSRTRHHHRSKSSTRENLSDTNLQGQGASQPLHHHHHHHGHSHGHSTGRTKRSRSHHRATDSIPRSDSEWMFRAASALASSAREEKGQSWLAKRESSTSLVSENFEAGDTSAHHHARMHRKSRSGRSTPAAFSRRGSLSRAASRRGSKPDLAMTGLEMTAPSSAKAATDSPAEDVRHFVPDFVDERIRAEMESIRRDDEDAFDSSSSVSSDGYFYSDDDIDEQEFQRLTRERGFGLGSWVDRVVGWTLFGDDDWPWASTTGPVEGAIIDAQPVVEERSSVGDEKVHDDEASVSGASEDNDGASVNESDDKAATERPGEHGGNWDDAGWLFRTMKRAFF